MGDPPPSFGSATPPVAVSALRYLIAGAIAKAIYPGNQGGGILGTMLLGIVGAFVGGRLYNLLTLGTLSPTATGFTIGGIFVAVIGAIVALFIYYAIARRGAY